MRCHRIYLMRHPQQLLLLRLGILTLCLVKPLWTWRLTLPLRRKSILKICRPSRYVRFYFALTTRIFSRVQIDTAKSFFALVPFDGGNGATSCPPHLLHTNDDGSSSPIELVAGAFALFDGAAFKSVVLQLLFVVPLSCRSILPQIHLKCDAVQGIPTVC